VQEAEDSMFIELLPLMSLKSDIKSARLSYMNSVINFGMTEEQLKGVQRQGITAPLMHPDSSVCRSIRHRPPNVRTQLS
jgi:hypothetical protein